MAEPLSLQTLLTYLTLISIPVGVFYHIMTLRNTRKNQQLQLETRQAQLFMQIYDRFNRASFVDQMNEVRFQWSFTDWDDFLQKYGYDRNPEAWNKLASITYFFEGLGVLVRRGLINPELVDDIMSGVIISVWEKIGPFIIEGRERFNWPTAGEWFEYLYNQIKALYDQQHPEFVDRKITIFQE